MKILLADDEIIDRKLTGNILRKSGHTVKEAENGRIAFNLFRATHFDVILTDWMMPEMDGLTLCKNIRRCQTENYVYIIVVSSRDEKDAAFQGLQSGADDYVIKPVFPDELLARVRNAHRIMNLEDKYKRSHSQLLQAEKMASIGQLAAGVAHEINNPTGFVSSNLKTLSDYKSDIFTLFEKYRHLSALLRSSNFSQALPQPIIDSLESIDTFEHKIDADFIFDDLSHLVNDCTEGMTRIKKIVEDLKNFAHPGDEHPQYANINDNIDSTLNVIHNEVKYKARVTKKYGDIPMVRCYPQQLNQVFMNIVINAVHAIEDSGEIVIETKSENNTVIITISDNGCGIKPEHLSKIFDPFFTTKDVGKGTGLGMNVAYNIIQKHSGNITVNSEVGEGTTFRITLPVDPPSTIETQQNGAM